MEVTTPVAKNPRALFDICVDLLLSSLEMSERASRHLPKKFTQYLLSIAMDRLRQGELNSDFIIHKLIEKWPYEQLSFNFKANPLARNRPRSRQEYRGCMPHEYYGLRGLSKSRLTVCSKDVAIGLFNHVYHSDREGFPSLQGVDLSDVQISDTSSSWGDVPAESFYKLCRGEFPGSDAYVCFSPEDFLFYNVPKPTLRSSSGKPPIKIGVNFKLNSQQMLDKFVEASSSQSRFQLQLKVLDAARFKGTNSTNGGEVFSEQVLSRIDLSELETVILSGEQDVQDDDLLLQPSCLWLLLDRSANISLLTKALSSSKRLRSLLASVNSRTCEPVLDAVTKQASSKLSALGLFGGQNTSEHYYKLAECLKHLSSSLQFLYLRSWMCTCMPFDVLSSCSKLRVLSIITGLSFSGDSMKEGTFGSFLEALDSMEMLEFVEIDQNIDIHAEDLVKLHDLLRKSLPYLAHWHMHINTLAIKKADIDTPGNAPVIQLIQMFFNTRPNGSLLYRSQENFSICQSGTAKSVMESWLVELRPEVCFRLGMEVWVSSSLLYAYSSLF